jgi:CRP/FNR family transcriptional regulator
MCGSLDDGNLAALATARMPVRQMRAGSLLYRQGQAAECYYIVLTGWLALGVTAENGAELIHDFVLPGTMIGRFGFGARDYSHTATCMTPVTVCPLPRAAVDALVARSPAIALGLVEQTAEQAARSDATLVNIAGRNARDRIAHLLVDLFRRVTGHLPSAAGQVVMLPLRLGQIGRATNLTHVHVSRMLSLLREQGMLRWSGHRLEILDPEALLRIAGFDTGRSARHPIAAAAD